MSNLPHCDSFEYLCYWSTSITNSFTLAVRGILKIQVDSRTVRAKLKSQSYYMGRECYYFVMPSDDLCTRWLTTV